MTQPLPSPIGHPRYSSLQLPEYVPDMSQSTVFLFYQTAENGKTALETAKFNSPYQVMNTGTFNWLGSSK